MNSRRSYVVISFAAIAASSTTFAQQDMNAARQRYERALATCNDGTMPRPERDACVRDVGRAWDRVQRGLGADTEVTSPGGRATVVVPQGSPPPRSDSNTITSPDGDSTIVLPADGSRPLTQ